LACNLNRVSVFNDTLLTQIHAIPLIPTIRSSKPSLNLQADERCKAEKQASTEAIGNNDKMAAMKSNNIKAANQIKQLELCLAAADHRGGTGDGLVCRSVTSVETEYIKNNHEKGKYISLLAHNLLSVTSGFVRSCA
jgi:hypothetical protein